MANSFGLLLAAIVICFIIARCMKDAKAFTRYMAILALSLVVGAGARQLYNKYIATPEKAAVVTVEPTPMHNSNTPVVWSVLPCNQDCAGQEDTVGCDSTVTEAEGLPTGEIESEYLDDS